MKKLINNWQMAGNVRIIVKQTVSPIYSTTNSGICGVMVTTYTK